MAGRLIKGTQQGAALLIFIILMVMAGLTYVVANLSPAVIEAKRAQKTNEALVQARDALIGFAAQYREQQAAQSPPDLDVVYGYLPPPDLGNLNGAIGNCKTEGCATVNAAAIPDDNQYLVGRIPWQTLGVGPLRDGHAECLWYAVSATHRSVDSFAAVMNWDTLSTPDIAIGSNKTDLSSVGAHDKPIAVIFSPGPAFDQGRTASNDAPLCGGNYDKTHYVDAALINNSQRALAITPSMLFGAIRQSANFRADINSMMENMVSVLRDDPATIGTKAKISDIPSNTRYDDAIDPKGYFGHYGEMIFLVRPGAVNVNGDGNCSGALIFSGQRSSTQSREDATKKASPDNYLETPNLESYQNETHVYSGATILDRVPVQLPQQDIVRCIPNTPSFVPAMVDANNDGMADIPVFASYQPATRILTLGSASAITNYATAAADLFACEWTPEAHEAGSGFRQYFRFRVRKRGEGFTFAIVDGDRNTTNACGGSSQHLGYSGTNPRTAPIVAPKVSVEFDLIRNTTSLDRDDPCFQSFCDPTPGITNYKSNAHLGIVYWGNDVDTQDDNVHGLVPSSIPRTPENPPKVQPYDWDVDDPPVPPKGVARLDKMGGTDAAKRDYHVRIEVSRSFNNATDPKDRAATVETKVWVEPHQAASIDAMSWHAGSPPYLSVSADSHGFSSGDTASIMDAVPPGYNGEYVVTKIDNDTLQIPLPLGAINPGPYVSGIAWTSNVATVTSKDHGLPLGSGSPISIKGAYPTEYNTPGVATVTATPVNEDTYTFPLALTNDPGNMVRAIVSAKQSSPRAQNLATTTRSMNQLDAGYKPILGNSAVIYDERTGAACGNNTPCPGGQSCGSDQLCYKPAFRNLRLGFTMGERKSTATNARNQLIERYESRTTWLP